MTSSKLALILILHFFDVSSLNVEQISKQHKKKLILATFVGENEIYKQQNIFDCFLITNTFLIMLMCFQ